MIRLFKLQITTEITSTPIWIEIMAESASQAQNKYWEVNPTHFICATVDMEENPDFDSF
jgi:hypothetical protein